MNSAEITHRRVLNVAIPIVISNATYPILGAVDTGVVGQLGDAVPIGAVGIGAIILSGLYWIFGFLRMGTSGLVAQARGAGDVSETKAIFIRGMIIGITAGLVIFALQFPLFWGAFQIAPASSEVEALAQSYMEIRIWGAPAAISLYAITGWLIAMERTRSVLLLQLWINGVNVALDLWFVLGLDMGVEGVAIATLVAEWTGLAVGLWLCRRNFVGGDWRNWTRIFDRVQIRRMASVSGDIMMRSMLLQASFMSFLFIGAKMGNVTLAANQILLIFVDITAYALDGFAFAAEALVGGAVGAKNRADLRRAAILSSQWGLGGGVLLTGVFLLFGPAIIDLMTTAPDVRIEAKSYLWWMVIFPLIGLPSWMFDGIFIGATRTRDMRIAMLQSTAVYIVMLFALVPTMGNHGLWLALMVFGMTRALTLWRYYPALEATADA
ncbi:MATE family efflux transporter [Rhodobacterales bacterium 52_120_T64]|nr:MATE family efflux transporter [Rhodobacterales bacterium 52_120_T64]